MKRYWRCLICQTERHSYLTPDRRDHLKVDHLIATVGAALVESSFESVPQGALADDVPLPFML